MKGWAAAAAFVLALLGDAGTAAADCVGPEHCVCDVSGEVFAGDVVGAASDGTIVVLVDAVEEPASELGDIALMSEVALAWPTGEPVPERIIGVARRGQHDAAKVHLAAFDGVMVVCFQEENPDRVLEVLLSPDCRSEAANRFGLAPSCNDNCAVHQPGGNSDAPGFVWLLLALSLSFYTARRSLCSRA